MWRPFLHSPPDAASCRVDSDPLIVEWWEYSCDKVTPVRHANSHYGVQETRRVVLNPKAYWRTSKHTTDPVLNHMNPIHSGNMVFVTIC